MFYSVSKSIDMDYREARWFRQISVAWQLLAFSQIPTLTGEEGGTHQAFVFTSQSPVWIQGVDLLDTVRGYKDI